LAFLGDLALFRDFGLGLDSRGGTHDHSISGGDWDESRGNTPPPELIIAAVTEGSSFIYWEAMILLDRMFLSRERAWASFGLEPVS
jgi:hypothetical protein